MYNPKSKDPNEARLSNLAYEVREMVMRLSKEQIELSLPFMEHLFKPFFGDKKLTQFDKEETTIEDVLLRSDDDLGMMDR